MIKEAISMVTQHIDLNEAEMAEAMRDIMDGRATDAQTSAFLTALRMKGETVQEITGAARIMREKATRIKSPPKTVDTCGTGGDMSNTFNISTTTAIVVAAADVPVAKHGNRSVSSRSGSADVLEALGIKIDLQPDKVERCLFESNFGFLFAPMFHPAMKYAVGPRREIGIRTIFNILGPLTNPAGAKRQILGVFTHKMTETMAQVLGNLGAEHAVVVHGEDGLDEITINDRTKVSEFKDDEVNTYYISPEDFNIPRASGEDILGGSAEENAEITISILKGQKGPKRDIILINTAAGLLVGGKAKTVMEGIKMAEETIDSGMAMKKLDELRRITNTI